MIKAKSVEPQSRELIALPATDNLDAMRSFTILAFVVAVALGAEEVPALIEAKAMDKEIQKLPGLPETTRVAAFRDMLQRIGKQDKQYQLALASNLAVSAGEAATDSLLLQQIADLLVTLVRDKPSRNEADLALTNLAEMSFYYHVKVSLDAPAYRAKLGQLEDRARTRAMADFRLSDTSGVMWHRKDLSGRVVLVHFWATWCPPCQREMPEFQVAYKRFAQQGLIILAITGEDRGPVTRYLAGRPVNFPVLLDPGDAIKEQFLVTGIPHSILYNRDGEMVAELPGPPTEQQLLDVLTRAGLK